MSSRLRQFTACCLLTISGGMFAAGRAAQKPAAAKPAPPPAAKPAAKTSADSSFVDIVNVSVVNVDVYVTDKKGNSVTGLTKDDFQLYENDRPVQITNFYSVTNGRATAPNGDAPPP